MGRREELNKPVSDAFDPNGCTLDSIFEKRFEVSGSTAAAAERKIANHSVIVQISP
jgi:hypothetical protein